MQPNIPVDYAALQQSLLKDGYKFIDGTTLVEASPIVDAVPRELADLPNKKDLLQELKGHLDDKELVAVLFLDLDNFKRVNDELGHAEGDKCLIEVVNTISSAIAFKGRLYRVGGDEFCALMVNFSVSEAYATAERIRSKIDSLSAFGGSVKVTASIGVAASDPQGLSSPESLVDASDKAMYRAKHTTKNGVCLWPLNPDETNATRKKSTDSRSS
jgi:diguanylate cyclase (GGDEF)-like protein